MYPVLDTTAGFLVPRLIQQRPWLAFSPWSSEPVPSLCQTRRLGPALVSQSSPPSSIDSGRQQDAVEDSVSDTEGGTAPCPDRDRPRRGVRTNRQPRRDGADPRRVHLPHHCPRHGRGGSTRFRPSRCSPSGRSSLDAPRSVVPFVTHPGDARGNCSGDYSCQNGRAALSRPGCDEIADDEPDGPVEYRVQAPLHSTLLAFTGKIVRHRMRAVACDCSCQWQIHALYPISAE